MVVARTAVGTVVPNREVDRAEGSAEGAVLVKREVVVRPSAGRFRPTPGVMGFAQAVCTARLVPLSSRLFILARGVAAG